MVDYKYRAICHTKCYWLENLWNPGEIYEGNVEPIKHFSVDGKIDEPAPPPTAGQDPRSNKEIREILQEKYNSEVPKNWTRKKLWAALHEFETAQDRDSLTTEFKSPEFVALCGFVAQSKAGKVAHERACEVCTPTEG